MHPGGLTLKTSGVRDPSAIRSAKSVAAAARRAARATCVRASPKVAVGVTVPGFELIGSGQRPLRYIMSHPTETNDGSSAFASRSSSSRCSARSALPSASCNGDEIPNSRRPSEECGNLHSVRARARV